jgi:L-Ala-D/L-Glu epimerase
MRLECSILELRTRHAFNIARAASGPGRRSVWVRIADGEGYEGWGEAAVTTPYYGETADTAMTILPRLGAVVAEAASGDAMALERIENAVDRATQGNRAARAGISAALHDLVGKRLGQPVWRIWGLDPRAPPSSLTIGIDDVGLMRERVREASTYPILKVKMGTADDERILSMIRLEAPEKRLRVDVNTAWTREQALRSLPMLEEYRVELIEQPLGRDDLEGLRAFTAASAIPVIADESCRTASDIPALSGAVDGVNVKLAKCGSLREAMRMIHTARTLGMRVMLGCMVESTLGIAAAVQLAPLADYLDLDGAALLAVDPFSGPGLDPDGTIRFNDLPGLGAIPSHPVPRPSER